MPSLCPVIRIPTSAHDWLGVLPARHHRPSSFSMRWLFVLWGHVTLPYGLLAYHASVRARPAPRRGGCLRLPARPRHNWVAVCHSGVVMDTGVLYTIRHQMSILNFMYMNNYSLLTPIRKASQASRIISTHVLIGCRNSTHRARSRA